jgi:hypothetical protein
LCGVDAIQGDIDTIIINPISSNILKWLSFKFVSWRHDFQPFTVIVYDCLIVGLLWFHYIKSLANVTIANIARNLLWGENDIKSLMLPWQPELVAYYTAKTS